MSKGSRDRVSDHKRFSDNYDYLKKCELAKKEKLKDALEVTGGTLKKKG